MNWKALCIAVLLLLAVPCTFAQSTNVFGTITDASGQAWLNGTYSLTFNPSPTNPTAQYYWNGAPFNRATTIAGNLDNTGAFVVSVPSNTAITPAGSTWIITVCPIAKGNTPCFTAPAITVTGSTQDISTTVIPPAIKIDLANPSYPFVVAYSNTEIATAPIGGVYYDFVLGHQYVCTAVSGATSSYGTCTTWKQNCQAGDASCSGGGGGSPSQGPQGTVQASDGSGHFQVTGAIDKGTVFSLNRDFQPGGPNPYFDARAFGLYYVASPPTMSCGINATSTTLNCSSNPDFLDASGIQGSTLGHGVVVPGAGPLPTISTPGTPTVTPNLANGGTTVSYKVIAEDYKGGLTAASAAGTTTTGTATLGNQTITVTQGQLVGSTGIATYTTSGAHNLQVGNEVLVCQFGGGSCPGLNTDVLNGRFYVASVPTSNTFTVQLAGAGQLSDVTENPGSGEVIVSACNTLTFPSSSYSGAGTLRYWFYRSVGAGAYSLVGYAPGLDPRYVDCGSPNLSGVPAYIPSSPPVAAQAEYLATTIAAGGGTNTLTLATAATTTVSSATVQHDNSTNVIACLQAASGQAGGGCFLPSTAAVGGSAVFIPFNALTDFRTVTQVGSSSVVTLFINGYVGLNQPWVLRNAMTIEGTRKRNSSFMYFGGAQVGGTAEPLLLGSVVNSVSLKNLFVNTLSEQQTAVMFDSDTSGQGSTGITFDNFGVNAQINTAGLARPIIIKAGFDYFFNQFTCDPAVSSALLPRQCVELTNSSIAVVGTGNASVLPGRMVWNNSYFLGSGVLLSALPNSLFTSSIGYTFNHGLTEAMRTPFITARGISFTTDYNIFDVVMADQVVGFGTPAIDSSSSSIQTVNWSGGQMDKQYIPLLIGNPATATLNTISAPTTTYGNTPYYLLGRLKSEVAGESLSGIGVGQIGYQMTVPGACVSCTVTSGGSVPVGSHVLQFTAVDANGNETTLGTPVTVTLTSGNQTVTGNTPTMPSGGVGWGFYDNGARRNLGLGCTPPVIAGSGTAFTYSSVTCGNSAPNVNSAQSSGTGPNGLFGYQVVYTNPANFKVTHTFSTATANRTHREADANGVEAIFPNFPVGPSGVPQGCVYTPGFSYDQCSWNLAGLVGRTVTGTTDTILSTDCFPKVISYQGTAAVAVALPTATTLAVPNCTFRLMNNTSPGANVVVTPATWTVNGGATLTIPQGSGCTFSVDASGTAWLGFCSSGVITAGANVTVTPNQYGGVTIAATGGGGTGCTETIANASSGGTTLNQFAKISTSPQGLVNTGTGDTHAALGVVTGGAGTTGSATVQTCGVVSVVADGTVAYGDFLIQSTTTAGHLQSNGSTYPTTQQAIAQALGSQSPGGGGVPQQVSSPLTPGGTSKVITVPSTAVGDTMFVGAQGFNGNVISSCQDNLSQTWTLISSPSNGLSGCYRVNTGAGVTSVTVNLGTSNTYNLQYYELSGVSAFCTSGVATTSTPTVTSSGNQCQNNSLYLGFVGNQNGSGAITPTLAGWTTLLSSNCCSGNQALASQWKAASAGSGSPVTYNPTASATQDAMVVVFSTNGTATIQAVLFP